MSLCEALKLAWKKVIIFSANLMAKLSLGCFLASSKGGERFFQDGERQTLLSLKERGEKTKQGGKGRTMGSTFLKQT